MIHSPHKWMAGLIALAGMIHVFEVRADKGPKPGSAVADVEQTREPELHPDLPRPIDPKVLDSAIRKGIDFLLNDQNDDGSWGSPTRTKDLNIMAGVGSHHAFRTATTALCVSALIETFDGSDRMLRAIERGEDFLLRELPKVRRDDPMLIYNVWAHGYGIQALVDMYQRRPDDASRKQQIRGLIRGQYDRLTRYESVEGGWGYYDFNAGTQRPAADSTSFVNATVLVAFREAKDIADEAPPEKVTKRAIDATERQKLPDFSYLYGTYLRFRPRMGINRPGGSLGRSQACNLALRLWGDDTITDAVVKEWLDRLITRNGWLDIGRKRPIPHESHFQVAGYFYYYGHYYATLCIELLPESERPFYQDHLAAILLSHQEKDGSWWDYPLYNYHQQYGTAFSLMALKKCQRSPIP
ncbi:MAG TPA: prenyltransferase/squalene oxidase repeat-containing protein [Isosphaeraceae bacterium]|nr:prenyltransferase/squalene oxidase repeat-containing protein [Isosphaeraceae bacterium]